MSRFYTSLGNLSPSFRLAVVAAFSLVAWLACEPRSAWGQCGDYVKIANPQFGDAMTGHGHPMPGAPGDHSNPTAPCQGPNCGQRAPLLPAAPAPVVVRSVAEQWADSPRNDDGNAAARGLLLPESSERPSEGYPTLLKRPPRA